MPRTKPLSRPLPKLLPNRKQFCPLCFVHLLFVSTAFLTVFFSLFLSLCSVNLDDDMLAKDANKEEDEVEMLVKDTDEEDDKVEIVEVVGTPRRPKKTAVKFENTPSKKKGCGGTLKKTQGSTGKKTPVKCSARKKAPASASKKKTPASSMTKSKKQGFEFVVDTHSPSPVKKL